MIKIDALYLLLLIELLIILIGTTVFFVLRGKKTMALYKSSTKDAADLKSAQEKLKKELAEAQRNASQSAAGSGDAPAMPKAAAMDHENVNLEVTILEEKLKEKDKLLADLQAKFDDIEKEYLILYQQQQAQGQKKE